MTTNDTGTGDVTAIDGVRLATYSDGPADAPVIVCVHGYPDDHTVWDGVTAQLADRYRVVRYDVRGAGRSGHPSDRSGYLLDQLAADVDAVIGSTGAAKVHLLAHDWGSLQGWHAVADPAIAARVASYTSISGPDLAHVQAWYRRQVAERRFGALASGLAHSWYIGVFLTPGVPELAWRRGLFQRGLPRGAGSGNVDDAVNGLELYRANIGLTGGRGPRRVAVPVQVLAPERDSYLRPTLQFGAPAPYVDQLRTEQLPGHHWVVVTDPASVATRVDSWAQAHPA